MNVLHMKYAVEVAKAGSINKASEILLVAQPNLSRSIKELEVSLGIVIFDRSSKGMTLTPEGEEFIGYATKILDQINDVEQMYKNGLPQKQKFSISVPRVSYISEAFARFSLSIDVNPAEIFYMETNSYHAIHNILNSDYNLGIIRYAKHFDKYFKALMEEKELVYEQLAEFRHVLLMHRDSMLASLEEIHFSDLISHMEIAHADPFVPSLPTAQVRREELPDDIGRRIFVFERASQFELLSENKDTFMWTSPLPSKVLERYDLVQRECPDSNRLYKDVLIYRKEYKLTDLDNRFISELHRSKQLYL
ncbi:MAG: LysR family transcriptional regulator [Oscillospiraceae bacterium]|nr:LysR family transcriptional regulator [Oscillospiraceae bacterium]